MKPCPLVPASPGSLVVVVGWPGGAGPVTPARVWPVFAGQRPPGDADQPDCPVAAPGQAARGRLPVPRQPRTRVPGRGHLRSGSQRTRLTSSLPAGSSRQASPSPTNRGHVGALTCATLGKGWARVGHPILQGATQLGVEEEQGLLWGGGYPAPGTPGCHPGQPQGQCGPQSCQPSPEASVADRPEPQLPPLASLPGDPWASLGGCPSGLPAGTYSKAWAVMKVRGGALTAPRGCLASRGAQLGLVHPTSPTGDKPLPVTTEGRSQDPPLHQGVPGQGGPPWAAGQRPGWGL